MPSLVFIEGFFIGAMFVCLLWGTSLLAYARSRKTYKQDVQDEVNARLLQAQYDAVTSGSGSAEL